MGRTFGTYAYKIELTGKNSDYNPRGTLNGSFAINIGEKTMVGTIECYEIVEQVLYATGSGLKFGTDDITCAELISVNVGCTSHDFSTVVKHNDTFYITEYHHKDDQVIKLMLDGATEEVAVNMVAL